jgi:hypothetical protein
LGESVVITNPDIKLVSIRIGWFVAFVLYAITGNSQNIPGSVYGVFSFGDIRERSSAYTRALGNTGVAVRDEYNINTVNPAGLTSVIRPVTSLFEIGTNYGSTAFTSNEASNSQRSGSLVSLNYWFRFSKKWASTIGATPFSNVSYSIASDRVFGATYYATPIQFQGTGGINQFYFGNAYDIFKNLSVGATVSFYLGSIKKSEAVSPTAVTNQFEVDKILTARGANFDVGLQYTLPIKKTKIIFGATWDKGACLSGTQQTAIVNPVTFDTLRKTDKLTLNSRLPGTIGGGIGVKRGRSTIAVDVHWMNWKNAEFDEQENYRNTFKYSVGYEYRGDFTSFKYLKTISFRGGVWAQDYPIPVQSTYLSTWGYTLGIALPIQNNRATIGMNYSITQLGVTKVDLVQESSHKFSLDIVIRDVWGIKSKFD